MDWKYKQNLTFEALKKTEKEHWTELMRWSAERLAADDQAFFIELLLFEAERRKEIHNGTSQPEKRVSTADMLRIIFNELSLRIKVNTPYILDTPNRES